MKVGEPSPLDEPCIPTGNKIDPRDRVTEKARQQSSNLLEGLIFLRACSIHFVHPLFGRRWALSSGRNEGVVFTGGSLRKAVRVPIGVYLGEREIYLREEGFQSVQCFQRFFRGPLRAPLRVAGPVAPNRVDP